MFLFSAAGDVRSRPPDHRGLQTGSGQTSLLRTGGTGSFQSRFSSRVGEMTAGAAPSSCFRAPWPSREPWSAGCRTTWGSSARRRSWVRVTRAEVATKDRQNREAGIRCKRFGAGVIVRFPSLRREAGRVGRHVLRLLLCPRLLGPLRAVLGAQRERVRPRREGGRRVRRDVFLCFTPTSLSVSQDHLRADSVHQQESRGVCRPGGRLLPDTRGECG